MDRVVTRHNPCIDLAVWCWRYFLSGVYGGSGRSKLRKEDKQTTIVILKGARESLPVNLNYYFPPNISIDCARDTSAMRGISLYQLVSEQVDRLEGDLALKTRCCAIAGQILGAMNSGINPRHLSRQTSMTLWPWALFCVNSLRTWPRKRCFECREMTLNFWTQSPSTLGKTTITLSPKLS
jgi:hypothetical protein